jgi:hypothetical protein
MDWLLLTKRINLHCRAKPLKTICRTNTPGTSLQPDKTTASSSCSMWNPFALPPRAISFAMATQNLYQVDPNLRFPSLFLTLVTIHHCAWCITRCRGGVGRSSTTGVRSAKEAKRSHSRGHKTTYALQNLTASCIKLNWITTAPYMAH